MLAIDYVDLQRQVSYLVFFRRDCQRLEEKEQHTRAREESIETMEKMAKFK